MHIHGLAHAASGYHRVLEENRKLYNQVQDLKGIKILLLVLKFFATYTFPRILIPKQINRSYLLNQEVFGCIVV